MVATLPAFEHDDFVESEPEIDSDIGAGDDILVVDDNAANVFAIETALAPLGRNVVSASSGIEALARLLEQDFALIVLDMAMPGMTGIETARLIRSRHRNRGTPIIFVTGMSWQDAAIDEAYQAGGFDFLVKPVRAELLRAKVAVFLKLQERTRALARKAAQLTESQGRLHDHELREQRKQFESEMLDAKLQQLAEGDRRQHELAAIIGNELLDPLHTLHTAFELLREHPYADKGERLHDLVEHRLAHVTRLVESLIDVAQLAAGEVALTPETVNLAEIVRHALDACAAVTDARKLAVELELESSSALLVLGDPVRLLQAVSALIDHAARSAIDGSELIVIAKLTGNEAMIRVDYASRVHAASAPRMFDVFGSEGARGTDRLAVGLALVKRLVELHDGSVRATSDPDRGTVAFELRLLLAPQDVELSAIDATLDNFDPGLAATMRLPALERPAPSARESRVSRK